MKAWRALHHEEIMARALSSSHTLYSELDLGLHSIDMTKEHPEPLHVRRWLVKLRGSLLGLNHRPFLPNTDRREDCSMCNMKVLEDVYHFVGVCPVLGEFRSACLGAWVLTRDRVVQLLNGDSVGRLACFCRLAWRYRAEMIREFNW